jgi:hypothetical protein
LAYDRGHLRLNVVSDSYTSIKQFAIVTIALLCWDGHFYTVNVCG